MATRSTTSEYQPSPPVNRLNSGKVGHKLYTKQAGSYPGIKPNMCCAPATNGDRVAGLAASQPASARKMMVSRNKIG